MKQVATNYKVLAQSAMFGRVRVSRGDVIRKELLGANTLRFIQDGIVEPIDNSKAVRTGRPTLL